MNYNFTTMTPTLFYYNQNARSFAESTISVDFSETQNRFLNKLPSDAHILDFGCGSGRDTQYFLEKGYHVNALDGSNGIWACSSILHLPKNELKTVFEKMLTALKENGWIYTSFKYGTFSGERNERYFTDFTEKSFLKFAQNIERLDIVEHWLTGDVRPGRGDERWLNLLLQKK